MELSDLIPKAKVVDILMEKTLLSKGHIKDRVMKRPDFPRPRKKIGRAEVYALTDIERFLNIH